MKKDSQDRGVGRNKTRKAANRTESRRSSISHVPAEAEFLLVREPLEWSGREPAFDIPEWKSLGCGALAPEQMGRHTLILGETGSGKSKSGIFPLVRAALNYGGIEHPELAPSMLIIDPKREIAAFAERVNEECALTRAITQCDINADDWIIDMFEGIDPMTLTADEYTSRVFAMSSAAEAEKGGAGSSSFFTTQAESIIRQLMGVELFLFRRGNQPLVETFWKDLNGRLDGEETEKSNAVLDQTNYLTRFARLLNAAALSQQTFGDYVEVCSRTGVPAIMTLMLASLRTMANETFTSVVATINNRLSDLASPDLARHVSLNPFTRPDSAKFLSVRGAMNDGQIVCYYPRDLSRVATTIGRCLKSKFFEFTFQRSNLDRPFVYVCDEFQRFITNDATSGEQSFLDRCRAYRGICILATQSLASLAYALGQDGDGSNDAAAIDILLNNTGNKLFFRNTDLGVHERLGRLLPSGRRGSEHVTVVRPVSTLHVGECYYMLSDGRWGRRQIELSQECSDGE